MFEIIQRIETDEIYHKRHGNWIKRNKIFNKQWNKIFNKQWVKMIIRLEENNWSGRQKWIKKFQHIWIMSLKRRNEHVEKTLLKVIFPDVRTFWEETFLTWICALKESTLEKLMHND